jgi:hypothetical protein
MEPAKIQLLSAIRVGDERNPPVKPRSRHLDNRLLAELANRCYEQALAHAAASESADWLIFRDGFEPWWREMLGQAADRVLPGSARISSDTSKARAWFSGVTRMTTGSSSGPGWLRAPRTGNLGTGGSATLARTRGWR